MSTSHAHPAVAQSAVASLGVPSDTLNVSGPRDTSSGSDPSTSSLLTAPAPPVVHSSAPSAPSTLLVTQRRRSDSPHSTLSLASSETASSLSSHYSLLPLRTFQRLHLLVFALTFVLLILLPVTLLAGYRRELQWQPFVLGVASWLAGETLREVLFELLTPSEGHGRIALPEDDDEGDESATARRSPAADGLALPTVVHAIAQELLRLGAVALTVKLLPPISSSLSHAPVELKPHRPSNSGPPAHLPPLDPLFFSVLWLALGWACVEILWGSRRLWKQLELYDEVLGGTVGVDEESVLRGVPRAAGTATGAGTQTPDTIEEAAYAAESGWGDGGSFIDHDPAQGYPAVGPLTAEEEEDEEEAYDEEFFQLRLREVQREELEAQLGVPLYEIPIGVVFIWRLDSLLLSLILTLLLSLPFRLTPPSLFVFPPTPTFLLVATVHAGLSLAWVRKVTSWGVPAVSYASLVLFVGMAFASLGAWGVLV